MVIEITPLAILVVLAGLLVIAIVIFIVFKKISHELHKGEDLLGMSRGDILKRWHVIEDLVKQGDEISGKLAIMEADKLLDHGLKAKYFGGTTLGERLKLACYKHPKLRKVWPAHLVRNKLVHEASYHLAPGAVRHNVALFRDALKELGLL